MTCPPTTSRLIIALRTRGDHDLTNINDVEINFGQLYGFSHCPVP
jgi:hypothetical protein